MHFNLNKKLSFLALSLVAITLVSCSGQPQTADDEVTIRFDLMNGTVYALDLESSSFIEEPDFNREGYDILGWYTSNDDGVSLDTKWNFFTMAFHYDLTLYAKVEVNTYQISFITNIIDETLPRINQRYGTILNLPKLARTGYTFEGWFEDELFTVPFNSSNNETMPARDVELYAKWVINQYSITYFEIEETEKITFISNGESHSVALSDKGRIFTWGSNFNGQLGLGDTVVSSSNVPQIINPPLLSGEIVTSISAGRNHTLILTDRNRVFGWGENLFSQLSGTTPSYILSPTLITMPNLSANENISKIFAGVLNSFVLTTTGRVFALGNNSTGQFGNGSSSLNPISQVQTLALQPTLASNERITDIAPAIDHTIYLTSLNKVYATGANIQGQLGIGNADPLSNRLNLISFSQLTSTEFISKIYANSQYSAAVSNQGKVFTWGNNEFSKLGDNTSVNKNTPTRINFLGLTSGERVTELNLSPNSAYAITSLGKFYSWGQNNVGQLGSGNFINRLFPQLVTLTLIKGSPIQMASSATGLRILTDQGFIFGFGLNEYGQMGWPGFVGDFSTSPSLTETMIKPYLEFRLVQISQSILDFNQNITLPQAPTKQGHTFAGWFIDSQYSIPFSPNRMGTSSFSVFAKWTKN
jgi:uncharacterized repeat protein (TIGR02543 family)